MYNNLATAVVIFQRGQAAQAAPRGRHVRGSGPSPLDDSETLCNKVIFP